MGGFLGIGGSSTKTDRKATTQSYGDLNSIFNFALPQAQTSAASGNAAVRSSENYWQSIVSGGRTAATQAAAPATNSINAASDAAKRQESALGTARGGGTAGANQQRATGTQAQIDQSLLQARPDAASKLAQTGTSQVGDALNALGIGENAGTNLGAIATKSQTTSNSSAASAGESAGKLAAALIGLL